MSGLNKMAKNISAARQAVSSSVRALDAAETKNRSSSSLVPLPTAGLGEICLALLASLRKEATTLALAFKPPMTEGAVVPQLDKIVDQLGRLISCVVAAAGGDPTRGGGDAPSALVDTWRDGVSLVGMEIERFFAVLEDDVRSGRASEPSTTGGGNEPYLTHIGMIWEAVDRLTKDFPHDEAAAAKLRWEAQKETVKDAWSEFGELLEEDSDDDDDEDDGFGFDDDDDEWGELEKAMGSKPSPEERNRAQSARPLLALHQILHSTLPRYLPLLSLTPEQTYAPLLTAGSDVVAAFDTAVSSMFPKQDVSEILGAVDALNVKGRDLAAAFRERLGRSEVQKGKEAAESFAQRWVDRLAVEEAKWQEARLGMAAMADALE